MHDTVQPGVSAPALFVDMQHTESLARQYELRERAVGLGWPAHQVVVIDADPSRCERLLVYLGIAVFAIQPTDFQRFCELFTQHAAGPVPRSWFDSTVRFEHRIHGRNTCKSTENPSEGNPFDKAGVH
jgi:hypothetical protein